MMRKHLIWEVPLHKLVRKTVTGSVNWGKADRDRSWRHFAWIPQYLTATEIPLKCSTALVLLSEQRWTMAAPRDDILIQRMGSVSVIGLWPASLWLIRADSYRGESTTSWSQSVFLGGSLSWSYSCTGIYSIPSPFIKLSLNMMMYCNYIPFSTTASKSQNNNSTGRIGHDLG